jgi:hypothetical protein
MGTVAVHVLGSALGACLGSALLLIMQGAGAEVLDLRTDVSGAIQRDTLGQPHVTSISVRLTPVVAKRADLDTIPSPERLAERSMIADSLRSDLGLWIAITPEVRGETQTDPYGTPEVRGSGGPRHLMRGARVPSREYAGIAGCTVYQVRGTEYEVRPIRRAPPGF